MSWRQDTDSSVGAPPMKVNKMDSLESQFVRDTLYHDVKAIIDEGLLSANASVDGIALLTYWRVGRRIADEIKQGESRADYGAQVILNLAERMKLDYAGNYSKRNLDYYCQFYRKFPDFEIVNACVHNLHWSHYRALLSVVSDDARYWYVREASREGWSARTLMRNIGSQYYQRLMLSEKKDAVIAEMQKKTSGNPPAPQELIKSPVVAEFLGFSRDASYTENDLESAIIENMVKFIMELGRGFSFVARQQHIEADGEDYYIDLVFYNYILKCFFLIDLKTSKLTHQDVGQMDMYVRMYDDLKRTEGDNPTIGLLLCAETGRSIAKYSVLNGSKQIFAAKYLTYLPTEEELTKEIERQRDIYYLEHPNLVIQKQSEQK